MNGFRLKDLRQWLAPGNASDILAHAASRCNLDCRFCYNKGASRVLNPVIRTPHMDQLAASGVRFTDFHVNPFCSPTRAALLTGRMSDRTGVTSTNTHRNYMRREEVLMSEYFKASGYRTGIFGKWHVGANYPYRPIDRGFDEWLGLGNNGLATSADLWDNDRMNDTYWHNGEPVKREGFCTDVYFDAAMAFDH